MASIFTDPDNLMKEFRNHWQSSTDDDNLTLHGFRRFKTTHLLNLRFLEAEIAELDHKIYQAGLDLNIDPSAQDRLGLKHCRRDAKASDIKKTITLDLVLKLRELIKQYDEALSTFNNVMSMETFSLLDNEKLSSLRDDLTLQELYKTRLVRVDLGPRTMQDPFQRRLHKCLRAFRYKKLSRRVQDTCDGHSVFNTRHGWSYQNTVFVAEVVGRFTVAAMAAVFLVVPLAILSHQSRKDIQLITVSVSIVILLLVISIFLKSSNIEIMVVAAAYAAVLSVFVSNIPGATA